MSIRSHELVAHLARVTGLPHDAVKLVLDKLHETIVEQLSLCEAVVLPKMMKVGVRQTRKGNWQLHISPYRDLAEAVGSQIERLPVVTYPQRPKD